MLNISASVGSESPGCLCYTFIWCCFLFVTGKFTVSRGRWKMACLCGAFLRHLSNCFNCVNTKAKAQLHKGSLPSQGAKKAPSPPVLEVMFSSIFSTLNFFYSELSQGHYELMGKKSCICLEQWCDLDPKKPGLNQCISCSASLLRQIPLKAEFLEQKQRRNSLGKKFREKVLYFTSVPPSKGAPEEELTFKAHFCIANKDFQPREEV